MELGELKELLYRAYSYDTCSPGLKPSWSINNPSLGQCAITTLIVNDFFGGKIMRCMTSTGSYYYNLIEDEIVDFTKEQFLGEIPQYENGEERTREYLLSNEDTKNRYIILNNNLKELLDDKKQLDKNRMNACIDRRKELEMDNGIKNALHFYLLATKLKYKIRSGWDSIHWHVKSERLESIAEHVYGTCILAISLDSEFDFNIDINKVLKMLTIHEIGEVLIGDITPFDNISPEEKENIEHQAMLNVLGDLASKEELFDLLIEFDEHTTKEAKFAYLCDKMEADIQAKVYEDLGMQRTLDDQAGNVVFKSPKIKEMIDNGAETAFDIWYLWDKSKFENESVFKRTLSYIKNNSTIIN